ncbi:MAG TPA: hypothetical protein VKB64_02845 [Gaiellaceae bacterium]|nr:hypothetical protein [Gaiellaceae bacterium]
MAANTPTVEDVADTLEVEWFIREAELRRHPKQSLVRQNEQHEAKLEAARQQLENELSDLLGPDERRWRLFRARRQRALRQQVDAALDRRMRRSFA